MEDSKLQEQQQPQDSPQGDAQQKQPPPAKEVIGKCYRTKKKNQWLANSINAFEKNHTNLRGNSMMC